MTVRKYNNQQLTELEWNEMVDDLELRLRGEHITLIALAEEKAIGG